MLLKALEKIPKNATGITSITNNLYLQEEYNINLHMYSEHDDFGYIRYNDRESVNDFNTFNSLMEEYIYLNISKYFGITFLEYINIPINQQTEMKLLADKYLKQDIEENRKQIEEIKKSVSENKQENPQPNKDAYGQV